MIRGGFVLDCKGNPWYRADVGICQIQIFTMGRLTDPEADVVIDAKGLYMASEFIAADSHAAEGLLHTRAIACIVVFDFGKIWIGQPIKNQISSLRELRIVLSMAEGRSVAAFLRPSN